MFLIQIKFKFEGFDAAERLELGEAVVNIETKGKDSGKCHNTGCDCDDSQHNATTNITQPPNQSSRISHQHTLYYRQPKPLP